MGHLHKTKQRRLRGITAGCLLLGWSVALRAQHTIQQSLTTALRSTQAIGLVMDVASGALLAQTGETHVPSAPGSVLKPLFLASALQANYVSPQTAIFCRRDLAVQTADHAWNLACTHPQPSTPFAAKEALAYSCNRYFAALADRMPPETPAVILHHYGLTQTRAPHTQSEKELLLLGLAGIRVSPLELAIAYRRLAVELEHDALLRPVRAGLEDSVVYGMAHNAAVTGVRILGKTGTASDGSSGLSHGWFAGIVNIHDTTVVVVVDLPRGNGADAAHLAHDFVVAAQTP